MHSLLRPVLTRWPLVALLSSALMLAIAHAFEAAGYEPCLLCLRQREVYWTAGGVALGGLVLLRFAKDRGWRVALDALLAVIFLVGLGVAVYHAGAEWKFWPGPTACAAGSGVSADAMADLLNSSKRIHAPSCEEPAWVFLGLSMAGWNALVSLKLTILSVAAAMLERNAR